MFKARHAKQERAYRRGDTVSARTATRVAKNAQARKAAQTAKRANPSPFKQAKAAAKKAGR